ncbi:class I SAM-dependent methyltransferase [Piscibacillus halophilus]|uniref:Methyltransferase domain-containing protein n=1 Tax=Piscibacillus halophilus TaxID=571933 RepID=A0A1H9DSZ3_9BACI|nr:class I SAM-dependent methyltransferase [Piscibacillus halophilus]SEQ16571.1 Methyltransferase domain-containing protein [Piscibacillus halophilus]
MLRSSKETKELFNQWATSYDEDLEHASGPLYGYQESLNLAKEIFPVKKGAKLLDIGIGTGAFANLLRLKDTEVWGIDLSEAMIEQCQVKHPDFHLKVGTFIDANVDETFDYVVSSFCFHEVNPEEREKDLRVTHQLLKTHGKLLILDIMFASNRAVEEGRQSIGKYWDSSEDYSIIGELDEKLRKVGFQGIRFIQTGPYHWGVVAEKR